MCHPRTRQTINHNLAERQGYDLGHRWTSLCSGPAVFIVSRERAKLGYFWRHAYQIPRCGPYNGNVVNPDTGKRILDGTDQLRRPDFRKGKACGDYRSRPRRG
jgi:hypothetical protein